MAGIKRLLSRASMHREASFTCKPPQARRAMYSALLLADGLASLVQTLKSLFIAFSLEAPVANCAHHTV